jgi:hypothetical protein
MDIDHIRALWQAEEVEYTNEAIRRMTQRGVSAENVGEAMMSGRIVEERPDAQPYASCTIRGWAERELAGLNIGLYPLNVACAVADVLRIITVYWEGE